jgi:hypothetical protein
MGMECVPVPLALRLVAEHIAVHSYFDKGQPFTRIADAELRASQGRIPNSLQTQRGNVFFY